MPARKGTRSRGKKNSMSFRERKKKSRAKRRKKENEPESPGQDQGHSEEQEKIEDDHFSISEELNGGKQKTPSPRCPQCRKKVETDWNICQWCMKELKQE